MSALSVLLPTFNSMALLRPHVESMKPWLDLAHEIVVVDSHSTDGTPEFLRETLAAFPLRVLQHPRGLYQSWNHGIAQATGTWLYISTVGDTIARDQLLHHLDLAQTFQADAVLSAPRWIDESGQPVPGVRWAVNDMLELLAIDQPRLIEGASAHFFAILHTYTSALLGSAASDLFRTTHLQQKPFPTDYGMSGDGAWGLQYAYDTRFVVTPRQGTTFRLHEKPYSLSDYHVDQLGERLHQLARATHEAHATRPDAKALQNETTLRLTKTVTQLYAGLKELRKTRRPWFLFPQVWQTRTASKHAVRDLHRHVAENASLIRTRDAATPSSP